MAENLFGRKLPTRAGVVDWGRMQRQAQEHLHRLGLDIDARREMGELSVGSQQLVEIARVIFSGDTVMDGGIGRTDFPGGSFDLLAQGIREKIFTLPGDFRIFPGHGGVSTVAEEIAGNAWLS